MSTTPTTAKILCLIEALHGDETVVQATTIQINEDGLAEVPLELAAALTIKTSKTEEPLFTPATGEDRDVITEWKRNAVPTKPGTAASSKSPDVDLYDAGPKVRLTIEHLADTEMVAPDNQPCDFDRFGVAIVGEKTALLMQDALSASLEVGQTLSIEPVDGAVENDEDSTPPQNPATDADNSDDDKDEEGDETGDENLTPYEKGQRTRAANLAKRAQEEQEATASAQTGEAATGTPAEDEAPQGEATQS